jgi:dTDP-4-amino-4,6-dideoxygalactose transaminase
LIKLSKSNIGVKEKNAVLEVLNKSYLGMGEEVNIFEKNLTHFLEYPSVCVINGTAALHLALLAIGVKKNDEVIVPSLTYLASFQAISATGAKPIPCDINLDTMTIDIMDAKKCLTKNTKAIMPVHYAGGVGDLKSVYNFASKHKLRVIEDAAHAFGSIYKNKRIGGQGDIICFSFDGIKNITAGEGGCISSKDEKVINYIKDARLLGVENDTNKRFNNKRSLKFDVKIQGWRYHMSNINAAIGIIQLKRFKKLAEKRKLLAEKYDAILKKNKFIIILKQNYKDVVPHIYPIRIKNLINRDELILFLKKKGIEIGFHYQPNHKLSLYNRKNISLLKNTNKVFNELLTLPLHPNLSIKEINFITKNLLLVIEKYIK